MSQFNSHALNQAARLAFGTDVMSINKHLEDNGYPYHVEYIKSDVVDGFDFEDQGVKMTWTVHAKQNDGKVEGTHQFRATVTSTGFTNIRFHEDD